MPRRQYRNPPIVEAVCLIHFAPGDEWSPVFPALLWDRVKGVYGGKPREQKIVNVVPNLKAGSDKDATAMAVRETTRIQYVTLDQQKILGVNQDDLSISVLRPYPGWEVFRSLIQEALAAYVGVAHPAGVRSIGLRYLNPIEIAGSLGNLLECLAFPPHLIPGVEIGVANFNSRTEYVYNDAPVKAAVGTVLLQAPEGRASCLLDIDMTREWPAEPLPLEEVMGKVDDMRDRERVLFESQITDAARSNFDA